MVGAESFAVIKLKASDLKQALAKIKQAEVKEILLRNMGFGTAFFVKIRVLGSFVGRKLPTH